MSDADKKAREELAKKAGGKGPMNTGSQGIKKRFVHADICVRYTLIFG